MSSYTEEEIRHLTVPLQDVQRTFFGLEYHEPMEFSAESIAEMLQQIADASTTGKAIAIHAVVRALRGLDEHHRLELRQVKPGKHKLSHHYAAEREQNQAWLERLAAYERDGMKTEAAVAAIAEEWGVSRASVFAGVKSAENMLGLVSSLEHHLGNDGLKFENPRPRKIENC